MWGRTMAATVVGDEEDDGGVAVPVVVAVLQGGSSRARQHGETDGSELEANPSLERAVDVQRRRFGISFEAGRLRDTGE